LHAVTKILHRAKHGMKVNENEPILSFVDLQMNRYQEHWTGLPMNK